MPPVSPTTDQVARQRAAAPAIWRADAAGRPAGDWADLGGLQVHTTGLAPVHWNGAHLTALVGLDHLAEADRWFVARDVPWGLLAPVELGVSPPGFSPVVEQPVMIRGLADLPQLSTVPLAWDAGADEVAAVQSKAFGDPLELALPFVEPKLLNAACDVVVARRDGRTLAAATGVVVDGMVGVYGVGTVPGARRQGLGTAVTLAVLHRSRERGADLAFLNPSDLGYGAYRSLGFADAPGWQIWSPSDRAATGTAPG